MESGKTDRQVVVDRKCRRLEVEVLVEVCFENLPPENVIFADLKAIAIN